ncbi:hypothetical protein AY601_3518 [Pedobacter cryoconitis]|uniref:DUF4254 domain-containing protein n=1 Tax=Pedobacter cryoconitis TaxID=188932 RepID=A0A127VGE6_9SPHI|nr:DUF4254 domain-containing protein [Pedobacter cryoconitis]AMQ00384.1 hypothetical protein AY601_3518 [Pedobacter cryoconitis]
MKLNTRISDLCKNIFISAIQDYHYKNEIDQSVENPYPIHTLEHLLYLKCWIDLVQWHMEDEVRNPLIDPALGLDWKRKIDASNQKRTNLVEEIDDYFYSKYFQINPKGNARINTESPAWAIDRLSILSLKIYHMKEEAIRIDATEQHVFNCEEKLRILLVQDVDLCHSLNELLNDIEEGRKIMKVYKQMKMYNDADLNPILYKRGV